MSGPVGETLGLLLAGGQARRFGGGDKGLRLLGGRPIMDRVVERARPQVDHLVINAAGDPARFAAYDLPVVADVIADFAGPLAGVLTGMEWAAANLPAVTHLVTFTCDAPFFPTDLVARLRDAVLDGAELACAMSAGRTHPVFGIWPVGLAGDLRRAMVEEDMRKIDLWTARYAIAHVDFAADPVDPFFNINRPDDLARAEALLRAG
ncbi:MAG: molybdenum cofactor guanylyltransferase MobA [Hyphomicrobiales bacterium]|nr:molybdenum cofactor guanylyltransferase MobA [Hyphomicrobiales bacterium]